MSKHESEKHDLSHEPISKEKIQEVMGKYDKESFYRKLGGKWGITIAVIATAFSLFQLYTAAFGMLPAQLQRSVHLGFVILLVFLLYPAHKGKIHKITIADLVLAIAGTFAAGYIVWNYEALIARAGAFTTLDVVVGAIGILIVM